MNESVQQTAIDNAWAAYDVASQMGPGSKSAARKLVEAAVREDALEPYRVAVALLASWAGWADQSGVEVPVEIVERTEVQLRASAPTSEAK